jgi:5'(3')-deoxyribonucleotidase
MMSHIFLDMDGVLVNSHRSIIDLFGGNYDHVMSNWPVGKYEIATAMGYDYGQFWDRIRKEGVEFWANAPAYPWAGALYEMCWKTAPIWFLTNPIGSPGCMYGKYEWLRKFTNNPGMQNYVMGKHKYLCSKPGSLLIDDNEINCDTFGNPLEGGGKAILFPAIWNRNHEFANDPLAYVAKEIEKWKEELKEPHRIS